MKRTRIRADWAIVCWVFSSTMVGCIGDDDGGDGSTASMVTACAAVEACEGAQGRMQCETLFEVLAPPAGCFDAVETASCEDHAASDPPYTDTCFPRCDAPFQRCEGDGELAACARLDGELRELRLVCEKVCARQGLTFSGTCGTSFGADRSEREVCWCEGASGPMGIGAGSMQEPSETLDPGPCPAYSLIASLAQESAGCAGVLEIAEVSRCPAVYMTSGCPAVLEAFFMCAISISPEEWACNASGRADVPAGRCESERTAAEDCLGEPL